MLLVSAGFAHASSYLYVIGGHDNSGTIVSSVWYAPVGAGGALGTWTSTSSYPLTVMENWAVPVGNVVYDVCGETTSTSLTNAVYTSVASSTGPLSAWTSTTAYPIGAYQPVVMPDLAGAYLYGFGGVVSGGCTSNVYSATVGGGVVGAWNAQAPFPTTLWEHAGCQLGGYAFIYSDGLCGVTSGVWSAPIGSGLVGAWSSQAVPSVIGHMSQLVGCGNTLYILGGANSASGLLNNVYAGTMSGGTVASWTSMSPLPIPLNEHGACTANGYLYVAGGASAALSSAVYYSPILGGCGGGLSSWTSTTALPAPLQEFAMAAMCFDAQGTPIPCCVVPPSCTATPTTTSTPTCTATVTVTSTQTSTISPTWTSTATITATYTATSTPTQSGTPTFSFTPTTTFTPSGTPTSSATWTRTWTASLTFTVSPSATSSPTCAVALGSATPPFVIVDRNTFDPTGAPLGIAWATEDAVTVQITVYNSAGELIRRLELGICEAGRVYYAHWDGKNYLGNLVAAGVYVIALKKEAPGYKSPPILARVAVLRSS